MIAAVIAAAVGGVTASAAAGAAVLNVRFGGDARTTRIVIDLDRATTGAVTQDGDGRPAANAVAAGKRPRSSMSPIIILDAQGRFEGALGSPGGSSILAYDLKGLIAVLDWGLPMQGAIDLPNLVVRGDNIGSETAMFAPQIQAALAAAGMPMRPGATEGSGLHGAIWREGRWDAGADPRREGVVLTAAR